MKSEVVSRRSERRVNGVLRDQYSKVKRLEGGTLRVRRPDVLRQNEGSGKKVCRKIMRHHEW